MPTGLALRSDFDPGQVALDAVKNDPNLQPSTKKQYIDKEERWAATVPKHKGP